MEKVPNPPTDFFHINSDDREIIDMAVKLLAIKFCKKYNCSSAVITEVVNVGKDGRKYLGFEIEKYSPAEKH